MKRHIEAVGALFVENGKVLAFEKGETKYPYTSHKFEFPGGKPEPGENPKQALMRELREELDMTAEVYDVFDSVTYEYPDLRDEEWAPADSKILRKIRSHLL